MTTNAACKSDTVLIPAIIQEQVQVTAKGPDMVVGKVTGIGVEKKKEEEAIGQLKKEYDPEIIERLLRYGYGYRTLTAELADRAGPSYNIYLQFLEEQQQQAKTRANV